MYKLKSVEDEHALRSSDSQCICNVLKFVAVLYGHTTLNSKCRLRFRKWWFDLDYKRLVPQGMHRNPFW